jgi:hypothetical protein
MTNEKDEAQRADPCIAQGEAEDRRSRARETLGGLKEAFHGVSTIFPISVPSPLMVLFSCSW